MKKDFPVYRIVHVVLLSLITALFAHSMICAENRIKSCFVGGAKSFHPIHLSYMEMHFNPTEQVFEATLKLYLDDIEAIIKRAHNVDLKLTSPKEHPQAMEYIMQYVKTALTIDIEGKKLNDLRFVGKEYDTEAVWIYFEIPVQHEGKNIFSPNQTPTALTIRNSMFHEMYADQNNMVHCTINSIKKSILLRKGRDTEQIRYK
jgi:hypothetical protein